MPGSVASRRAAAVFGAAVGLGILSKGPVILVTLAIPALLAPLWIVGTRPSWARWYLGIAGGLALGLAIAACWVIPAALSGGEAYARSILWEQTAERVAGSFAHQHPFWWYVPLLPLLVFPWIAWPPLWRALRRLTDAPLDSGTRLTLLWSSVGLLAFSAISAKQPHYLLPLFPALALLAARAASALPSTQPRDSWLPGLGIVLAGILLAGIRFAGPHVGLPDWTARIPLATAVALAAVGSALVAIRTGTTRREAGKLAAAVVVVVATLQSTAAMPIWANYDVRPAASWLKGLEARGVPIAHVGIYHGQFHFAGRLMRPLEIVPQEALAAWFEMHPDGRAVAYVAAGHPVRGRAEFSQPFRGAAIVVVGRGAALSLLVLR
jgi:4-amino-4-deoxy-L-arabinose transferase-like glycosyltransferase